MDNATFVVRLHTMATIKQLQAMLIWLKKNRHIKQSALAKESGLSKFVISRVLSEQTPISSEHYEALYGFCKRIGFDPKNKRSDSQ